jgi:hypothetical protein
MMKGFFVTELLLRVIEDSAEGFLIINDDRKRTYKEAVWHEEVPRIIASERGSHFAPDVVDVFEQNRDAFKRIQTLEGFLESSVEQLVEPVAQLPTRGAVT